MFYCNIYLLEISHLITWCKSWYSSLCQYQWIFPLLIRPSVSRYTWSHCVDTSLQGRNCWYCRSPVLWLQGKDERCLHATRKFGFVQPVLKGHESFIFFMLIDRCGMVSLGAVPLVDYELSTTHGIIVNKLKHRPRHLRLKLNMVIIFY